MKNKLIGFFVGIVVVLLFVFVVLEYSGLFRDVTRTGVYSLNPDDTTITPTDDSVQSLGRVLVVADELSPTPFVQNAELRSLLKGKIILSSAKQGGDESVKPLTLDVVTGEVYAITIETGDDFAAIAGVVSPTTNKLPLLYSTLVTDENQPDAVANFTRLALVNQDGTDLTFLSPDSIATLSTSVPISLGDGRIVFSATRIVEDDSAEPLVDSSIVTLEGESLVWNEIKGANPVPHPFNDRAVVYVGEGGLATYNIETGEQNNLITIAIGGDGSNFVQLAGSKLQKISISPNGRYIALSDYYNTNFYIFTVSDWNPGSFTATLKARHPIAGFWSTFSPDNRFVAVQLTDTSIYDEEGSQTSPVVVRIYDVETGAEVYTKELPDYWQLATWLSDWVY